MQTITLPIWAFAAAVGLPGICLIWMIIALVRSLRKADFEGSIHPSAQHAVAPAPTPGLFTQELLALQIDTVLNGLAALIETERIKLNTLLGQNLYPGNSIQQASPVKENFEADKTEKSQTGVPPNPVGQRVAQAMASGQGVDKVATQLGLSHAEVELALKLNQAQSATPHRKLEAVA